MNRLRALAQILRYLGARWIVFRLGYAIRKRCGILRRATPQEPWDAIPAPALALRVRVPQAADLPHQPSPVDDAEAILQGRFRLFGWDDLVECGRVPDWMVNQLDHRCVPAGRHWTDYGDFSFGDIKGVWELSRFGWAFSLTGAYRCEQDERYSQAFWALFGDWCRANPPNSGPNWMCGQEATFRLMAVIFAAEGMDVPPDRRQLLSRFVVATARRIASNLDYALSQQNNHGISECVGLITAAGLVPNHAEAARWLDRGERALQTQLADLVYPDGSFAQHSLVYHRVLLHVLSWGGSRYLASGRPIPAWLAAAAARALNFMMQLVDPETGGAPLFGLNDGANVLPISKCSFLDMRPAVQLAAAIFSRELPLPAGPWDESIGLLSVDPGLLRRAPWPQAGFRWHAGDGGYARLVSRDGRLFFRCPTRFRHRPAQADMLHVDVWRQGRAVAQDAGSYSYHSKSRFTTLADARQHNVLTIDSREPIEHFSRFLYLPWPQGNVHLAGDDAVEAGHNAYSRIGVRWSRCVSVRPGGGFFVVDRLQGCAGHAVLWQWRLADLDWQQTPRGLLCPSRSGAFDLCWSGIDQAHVTLVRGDVNSALGWTSKFYHMVEPAVSLQLSLVAVGDIEASFEFVPRD